MADPYLLTEQSANKLRQILSESDKPVGYAPVPNESWVWVKRGTSAGTVSGVEIFNGRIQYRKGPGSAWTDAGTADVVLFAANSESLVSGKVYLCAPVGYHNGKPCYAPASGGGGTVDIVDAVCNEDGTLTVTLG